MTRRARPFPAARVARLRTTALAALALALAHGAAPAAPAAEGEAPGITAPGSAAPAGSDAASSPFGALAEKARQQAPVDESERVYRSIGDEDLKDQGAYAKWLRQFARESWEWHLLSTKLLMAVVLGIVVFGLYVTYLQFTRELRKVRIRVRTGPPATGQDGNTPPPPAEPVDPVASKLKIGPEGLEVTSQVIGLLVLAFSLAFFYLYVKEVYPMQEVELQKNAQSSIQAASK